MPSSQFIAQSFRSVAHDAPAGDWHREHASPSASRRSRVRLRRAGR